MDPGARRRHRASPLSIDEQRHILEQLDAAEALEKFLGTKYLGQKRFGIDGAESTIPLLDALLSEAADARMDSVTMGMAHRGRLNVLVNIVGKNVRAALQRVRGRRRSRFHPGIGRRQVPPRPARQASSSRAATRSPSRSQPTRRTSRPSTPSSSAWPVPAWTRSNRPATTPCSRS